MVKYHINTKGEPGLCKAQVQCPFGDATAHYSTIEQARLAYEEMWDASKQNKALDEYQKEGFEKVNQQLREGQLSGLSNLIDTAFETQRTTLPAEQLLYRGIDRFASEWSADRLQIGDVLTENAFMSTSSSPDAASWFATGEDDSTGTVLKITNPEVVSALKMSDYGSKQMEMFGITQESEYLLPRGLDLQVTGKSSYTWEGESYRVVEVKIIS